MPDDEKKLIMELHRTGLKPGEIVEKLWHEHEMVRTTDMIDALIRRENKKKITDK